jgi:IPT/TIG domain/NHL repeat
VSDRVKVISAIQPATGLKINFKTLQIHSNFRMDENDRHSSFQNKPVMLSQILNSRTFFIPGICHNVQKMIKIPGVIPVVLIILFFSSCKKDDAITNPPPPPLTITIKSIKPPTASPGDTIIIVGTNFSQTLSKDTVKFNAVVAQVIKASADTLYVIVPAGNTSGVVTVNGILDSGFLFTSTPLTISITSVSPAWGKQGDTILIIGTHFNTNPAKDTVTINGVSAQVLKASADTLYIIVPLTSTGPIIVNGVTAPSPGFIYGPTVIVTTVAGSGPVLPYSVGGYVDGPVSLAQFNEPTGLSFDKQGNLFVSEYMNASIREISAGTVSTFAGSNTGASIIGPNLITPLLDLDGIAIDAEGNIYVTQGGFANNLGAYEGYHSPVSRTTVQKISNGIISSFGGFYNAGAMSFDSQGNLYVAESGTIQKITPSGQLSTFVGKGAVFGTVWLDSPYRYSNQWILNNGYQDGQDTATRFGDIVGLAIDAGDNIYATDMGCSCIRKVTSSGLVTYFALGSPSYNPYNPQPFVTGPYTGPVGICVDAMGNVYATEGNSIVKITPAGVVNIVAGSNTSGYTDGPAALAQFNNPNALALDAQGNLYVLDAGNNRIRKITFH